MKNGLYELNFPIIVKKKAVGFQIFENRYKYTHTYKNIYIYIMSTSKAREGKKTVSMLDFMLVSNLINNENLIVQYGLYCKE